MRVINSIDKYNDYQGILISLADDEIPLQGYWGKLWRLSRKDSKVFMYGVNAYSSDCFYNTKKHSFR